MVSDDDAVSEVNKTAHIGQKLHTAVNDIYLIWNKGRSESIISSSASKRHCVKVLIKETLIPSS